MDDRDQGAAPGGLFDEDTMRRLRLTPVSTAERASVDEWRRRRPPKPRPKYSWSTRPRPLWLWIVADQVILQFVKRVVIGWPLPPPGEFDVAQRYWANFIANSLIGLPMFIAFMVVWRSNAVASAAGRVSGSRRAPRPDRSLFDGPGTPAGGTSGALVVCPHCGVRVLPTAGRCPACLAPIDGAPPPAGIDGVPPPAGDDVALLDDAAIQVRDGVTRSQVVAGLTARGMEVREAAALVSRLERATAAADRASGWRVALIGAIVGLVGVAATALSYQSAVRNGGDTYWILWGPMLLGAILLWYGMARATEG